MSMTMTSSQSLLMCLGYKTPHFIMVHGKHIMLLLNTDVCWRWQEIFKDWSSFVTSCLTKEEEMLLLPGLPSARSRYALCTEPVRVATKPKSLRASSSKLGIPKNILASSSLWWGRLRFQRGQGELWHWPVLSQLPAAFCNYSNHSCNFHYFSLNEHFLSQCLVH